MSDILVNSEIILANAELFYVIERMTEKEVAQQVGVHERTIRRWKKEHNWDVKKDQYFQTASLFHKEMYNFARKLMISIEYDLDNGNEINSSRMYTFAKILPLITKIKDYEDNIKNDSNAKIPEGITPDFVELIETEILGMKPKNER